MSGLIYRGPDNSGFVMKLVKEQGILPSADIQTSKSQESTILYCEVQGTVRLVILIYVILSSFVMHNISR